MTSSFDDAKLLSKDKDKEKEKDKKSQIYPSTGMASENGSKLNSLKTNTIEFNNEAASRIRNNMVSP